MIQHCIKKASRHRHKYIKDFIANMLLLSEHDAMRTNVNIV